jgi:LysM repeat protein
MAVLMVISASVRAQDSALEERVNKLNGYVQDLLAAQDAQRKQIEALAAEIQALREKAGQSSPNSATSDDLRRLAEKVQEVDRKRENDRELILKELEALGKTVKRPVRSNPTEKPISTGAPSDKGYEHEVQPGETLSAIVAAYKNEGINVTVDQILKANPGLKPNSMKVGQKIFIPAPQ